MILLVFIACTVPDKQNQQILLNAYFSLKSPENEFFKNAPLKKSFKFKFKAHGMKIVPINSF